MRLNHAVSGGHLYFREEQAFRQKWLWFILIGSSASIIVLFGYGVIRQLLFGHPWGARPMSDLALVLVTLFYVVLQAGLIYLFHSLRLITEVRDDGIHVRFYPFSSLIFPFGNIRKFETRKYNPVREYGGWGIRHSKNGKAYNVSGNLGVQLEFYRGNPVLIGSKRPDDMVSAIHLAGKI